LEPATPLRVPAGLTWLSATEAGRAWLASLPALVEAAAGRWSLQIGEVFDDSYVSFVVAVRAPEGPAVLKLQWPHRESEHEAAALERWDGDGAIRLLAHHPPEGALLVECCYPGTLLSAIDPDQALGVLIELLPRLWKAVGAPFRSLEEEALGWSNGLLETWERAGRPFERRLFDAAVETIHSLLAGQHEQVLLHQDLHGDNVLAAERQPWLAIDPKPLVGDRAFSPAPIIRSHEFGHGRSQVLERLDRLSAELGLDRQRVAGWAFAQTVAWAFEDDEVLPRHVETARWLLEAL